MDTKLIRLSANPAGFGDTPDELEGEMFESALPVQHSHSAYENDDIGLYVGLWDTTTMTEVAGPYACDEFMWLLEGEVGIRNNKTGEVETVGAGEAFVIPRGYDCQWQQKGYLRKYYVIYEPPEIAVPPSPVVQGVIKPQLSVSAERGRGPLDTVSYRSGDGQFWAGSWQAGPFDSGQCSKPYHQFVYLETGRLDVTERSGEVHSFVAGEAFFLPAQTVTAWKVEQGVGMLYTKVCA